MKHPFVWALIVLVSAARFAPVNAAAITVNTSVRTVSIAGVNNIRQTIDGFGVFGAMMPWWFNGPFYNDAFLSLYIDTLGITLLRTELYPLPDQTALYTKQLPYLRAIMAKAQASHEPLAVYASIWTPPASMKTSNTTTGGFLIDGQQAVFGDYVVNYVRRFNTDMGYNLYAVSGQNEPALSTGYNSCPYDNAHGTLGKMVIAVAAKFKTANLPCWLHYSDNIPWGGSAWHGSVVGEVCQNNVADSICHIMSTHYGEQTEIDLGSSVSDSRRSNYYFFLRQCQGADTNPTWMQDTRRANKGKKSRMWNTEWGGFFNVWKDDIVDEGGATPGGAWTCARSMFFSLKAGFNAITYWQGCDVANLPDTTPYTRPAPSQHYGMMYYWNNKPHPGPLFYVLKKFYRYIRPGAIRIGCSSDDSTKVNAIAFAHDSLHMTTVVLINYAATQQTAVVNGSGLPSSMSVYQTSPTQNCVRVGAVAPGGSVTLPPQSITTLCNPPSAGVVNPQSPQRSMTNATYRRMVLDINGRVLLSGNRSSTRAGGIRVVNNGSHQDLRIERGIDPQ